MVFSSTVFLYYFLPVTLALYFLAPKPAKNAVLFVLSLVFYAWGEPVYVLLMLFTVLLGYLSGLAVERLGENERGRRAVAAATVAVDLIILGIFKYSGFVVSNLNSALGTALAAPAVALPIGISFYTFQTISYTVDVLRRKVPAQRNFISFGAYVAMFPQLIAGPIVRYSTVAEELDGRRENADDFAEGIARFCCGLAKKVLIANNVGLLWDTMYASLGGGLSVAGAWLGIIAFSFQIYFDFSGYSDMAIGLGRMFGFHFLENFDHPYVSRSVTEFWRRWHISLGTWFREYVYIPLGGNRRGAAKTYRNILAVWLLTGLWHGASWNFVLWGLYYCLLLMAEKSFLLRLLEGAPRFVSHIYTLLCVALGWVIFAVDDIGRLGRYIKTMFGAGGAELINGTALYELSSFGPVLLIAAAGSTGLAASLTRRAASGRRGWIKSALCVICVLVCTCYLVDSAYNPFLYFRF